MKWSILIGGLGLRVGGGSGIERADLWVGFVAVALGCTGCSVLCGGSMHTTLSESVPKGGGEW